MYKKIINNFFASILLAVTFVGCVDIPKDFVTPVWDVSLEVPIAKRTFTLEEAIENDTLVKAYDDPDKLGLLYYSDKIDVESISIEDNVKFDGFDKNISQNIGSVKTNNLEPITTDIAISDWTPITPGVQIIFPEIENEIRKEFTPITAFESATIESGIVTLTFTNNLPVDTELREFRIENSADNSVVISNPVGNPVVVPAYDSTTVSYNLEDKVIRDQLAFSTTLYTEGSNGQLIEVPSNAGTKIKAEFSDLVIKQARAEFPEQEPFGIDDQIVIGDSIFVETAIFKEGSLNISFDNYIDLQLAIQLDVENLKLPDGSSYSHQINLRANERNRLVNINDLTDWRLEAPMSGQQTNKLTYSVRVKAIASDGVVTLRKDDSIAVNINLSESTFKYFAGRIKPLTFSLESKTFALNLGNFNDNFDFNEVFFEDPGLVLNLATSADVEFELNGELTASNASASHSIQLDNVLISNNAATPVDLQEYGFKELLNSFSNDLPDKFDITGDIIINPGYKIVTINETDSVAIDTDIEIPLDIGIGGGTFQDTLKLNTTDSSKAIENINYASLTMELQNHVPVSVEVTGYLTDPQGNRILNIPPEYNSINSFTIPPPSVDENGNVLSPGISTQQFELIGEDVQKFLDSPNLNLDISLLTPPKGESSPVKFHTTDSVTVRLYGKVEYRVDFDEEGN